MFMNLSWTVHEMAQFMKLKCYSDVVLFLIYGMKSVGYVISMYCNKPNNIKQE